jgi:ComF family protein
MCVAPGDVAPGVMLRLLADAALAVLLAPCCAVCGVVLERPLDGAVCPACWARVARFSPPVCRRCGEPLPSARAAPAAVCPACSVTLGAATAARSVGAFDGALADIVHALKYGRRPTVAAPLAVLMRAAGGDLLAGVDLVVPVPLHRRRERERGFNQAEALARGLGPTVCLALARPRSTAAQVGLSGAARRANLHGAFTLTRAAAALPGRAVALVDDVLTTGATVSACADVLATAGPRAIVAITAARAASGPRP